MASHEIRQAPAIFEGVSNTEETVHLKIVDDLIVSPYEFFSFRKAGLI